MTVAEQLLRKMCDARQAQIKQEHDADVQKATEEIDIDQLARPARKSARELVRLRKLAAQHEETLKAAGYTMNHDESTVMLLYKNRDRIRLEHSKRWYERRDKVGALRDKLSIHLMGMEPKAAKMELLKLQKQLEAI